MRLIQLWKNAILVLLGILLVFVVAIAVYPFWEKLAKIEEKTKNENKYEQQVKDETKLPEAVHLQVIYVMDQDNRNFSELILEILNLNADKVFYLNVPVNSKVTLSQELYQELLVHSPGLPQYMKLSKIPEEFSEEYRMEGCTKILQEMLGVAITNWICTDEATVELWKNAIFQPEKKDAETFWNYYEKWISGTKSNQSSNARRMYYESFLKVTASTEGTVPRTESVGEFTIQKVHTQGKIEELLRKSGMEDTNRQGNEEE